LACSALACAILGLAIAARSPSSPRSIDDAGRDERVERAAAQPENARERSDAQVPAERTARADAFRGDAPRADAPRTDAPRADAARADAPRADETPAAPTKDDEALARQHESPGSDPLPGARVAYERRSWDVRLAREDDFLIEQLRVAGLDGERERQVRAVLEDQRAARARAIEDYEAGRIERDAFRARARENKTTADRRLHEILTPREIAALDPVGARAAVVAEERR
jgi:hypothetical protein